MKTKTSKSASYKLVHTLALGVLALAANQANASGYTFTALGTFPDSSDQSVTTYALNNSGQAVGLMYLGQSNEGRATLWNPGAASSVSPINLGSLGGTSSGAMAINNLGQAAGFSRTAGNDFTDTRATYWDGSNPPVDLGVLPGGSYSAANGINDAGQIVGATIRADDFMRATLWNGPGAPVDLGTLGGSRSNALAINASGQIAGSSDTRGDVDGHGAFWNSAGSAPIALDSLGGTFSSAYAINDAGQIAGYSDLPGDIEQHAVFWNGPGTGILDLGTLGDLGLSDDGTTYSVTSSYANDINNAGQVVGYSGHYNDNGDIAHGFLWDGGNLIDLNSLLSADTVSAGWVIASADGINDQGVILGTAFNTNDLSGFSGRSFLMTPVPVPAVVWLFGSALAGLIGATRLKQAVAA